MFILPGVFLFLLSLSTASTVEEVTKTNLCKLNNNWLVQKLSLTQNVKLIMIKVKFNFPTISPHHPFCLNQLSP